MKRKNTSHCMCRLRSASSSCDCPKTPIAFKEPPVIETVPEVVINSPKVATAVQRMKARQAAILTALDKFYKGMTIYVPLPFTDLYNVVAELDIPRLRELEANYALNHINAFISVTTDDLVLISEETTVGMVDPSSKLLAYWKEGFTCDVNALADKAKIRECFELYEMLLTFLTFRQLYETAKEILESQKKHQSTIQRLSLKAK